MRKNKQKNKQTMMHHAFSKRMQDANFNKQKNCNTNLVIASPKITVTTQGKKHNADKCYMQKDLLTNTSNHAQKNAPYRFASQKQTWPTASVHPNQKINFRLQFF